MKLQFTPLKSIALLSYFIFLLLTTINFTYAQRRMKPERFSAWEDFKNNNGNNWKVKWNNKTGGATVIRGNANKCYNGQPEQVARQFLEDNRNIFGMTANLQEFNYLKTVDYNGRKSVKFSQYYQGLPVYTGGYSLIIDENNRIPLANGHYFSDISISIIPKLNATEATAKLINIESLHYPDYQRPEANLIIYPLDEEYKLAWQIFLQYDFDIRYCGFINAVDGTKIDFFDMIPRSSIGSANVYEIDPASGGIEPKTLYRMVTGTSYLIGDYVDVVSTEEGTRAYSRVRNFSYQPSNYHFNEANAYWHVDRIANDYFNDMLDYDMPQIPVYIQGSGGLSPWDPFPHIVLGLADTTSPFGVHYRAIVRKDDQIYHEYSHQICWDIGHEYYPTEVASKAEGYADYFACSFTDDPIYGEWAAYETDYLRTCDNNPNYFNYANFNNLDYNNYYNGNQHRNGMIWSGALWDMRDEFDQEDADQIIFLGLNYVNGYSDFEEALEGIINAASDLGYNEASIQTIKAIFSNRGIYADLAIPTNFDVTGNVGAHPTATWDNNTEPDIYGYKLYRSIAGGPYLLRETLVGKYNNSYTDQGITITDSKFDPQTCYKITALDTHLNESEMSNAECVKSNAVNKDINYSSDNTRDIYSANIYPNPFNSNTRIFFNLPEKSTVSIFVYNLSGEEISNLLSGIYSQGTYNIDFNGYNISSGIYFVKVVANSMETNNSFYSTMKIALVK